jgi:hypothetical protein
MHFPFGPVGGEISLVWFTDTNFSLSPKLAPGFANESYPEIEND